MTGRPCNLHLVDMPAGRCSALTATTVGYTQWMSNSAAYTIFFACVLYMSTAVIVHAIMRRRRHMLLRIVAQVALPIGTLAHVIAMWTVAAAASIDSSVFYFDMLTDIYVKCVGVGVYTVLGEVTCRIVDKHFHANDISVSKRNYEWATSVVVTLVFAAAGLVGIHVGISAEPILLCMNRVNTASLYADVAITGAAVLATAVASIWVGIGSPTWKDYKMRAAAAFSFIGGLILLVVRWVAINGAASWYIEYIIVTEVAGFVVYIGTLVMVGADFGDALRFRRPTAHANDKCHTTISFPAQRPLTV